MDDDNLFAMPPSEGGGGDQYAANNDFTMVDNNDGNDNAFASPPQPSGSSEFVMSDSYAPMADDNDNPAQSGDENPIILGAPEDDNKDDSPGYLGDVTESIAPEPEEPSGPSPMQQWNEEWQQTLVERKDAENARKAELVEKARDDLEKFQQEREQRRESRMNKNREDEQAKLEAIEADLENDNSWQRVCKMVDLSHDSTAKAQDNKRMRDVLILLKNETSRAEALTN